MSRKIVVALGGNAILSDDASATAQQAALKSTAKKLVKFVEQGDQLVVSHGNGPQVGNLLLQQATGSTPKNPAMPLDTAVAMTQGSMGYWLENALGSALADAGLSQDVATVVTQVLVDDGDPAFKNPSKPIGPFYTAGEVAVERRNHPGYTYVEDAGRGYRRVVASPKPTGIKEATVVNHLVDAGIIPVSVGGGGVPVVQQGNELIGREAVVDKDFASEKLAELIGADLLVILTAVDHVFVNFNQTNQKQLNQVTVAELNQYMAQGQFAKGSMLPKVQAAIEFVQNHPTGKAVITSLNNVNQFLQNGDGTIISQNLKVES